MKKLLSILVLATALFACKKEDDRIKLQLNLKSCVLDNETSFAEVKVDRGGGFLAVTSSDPETAEVLYDGNNGNLFYIIGHNRGNAAVTVSVFNDKGVENTTKTIDVRVNESIEYPRYAAEGGVYLRKGDSRFFKLPFAFEKNYNVVTDASAAIDTEGAATFSASVEMGSEFKVDAKATGSILFNICKGKVILYSVRVYVVDEYDLCVPPSEDRQLTFKLPFTYGVNGITIWRGSGKYTARIADETVAKVESITSGEDHFNSMNNSAVVRVTPLKIGTTKLIITDTVTRQTASVDVVVN
jgi:hypothetical protein